MPLLQTTTAEGVLRGMILGRAPQELAEQEAAYLQDVILNQPGFASRRGAMVNGIALGNNFSGNRPVGVVSCYDPAGNFRIMVLYMANLTVGVALCGSVYDSSFTFLGTGRVTSQWPVYAALPVNGVNVSTSPGIDGGVIIGVSDSYGAVSNQFVVHWWGGYGPSLGLNVNQVAVTITKESTTATLSIPDTAKLRSGLVINGVGVIKAIASTTTVTLMAPYPYATLAAATVNYGMTHGLYPARTRGKISCATGAAANTAKVTGFGTRFQTGTVIPEHVVAGNHAYYWVLRDPVDLSLIAERDPAQAAGNDTPSDTVLDLGNVTKNRSLAPYVMTQQNVNAAVQYQIGGVAGGSMGYSTGTFSFAVGYLWGWINFPFHRYQFYANSFDPGASGGASLSPVGTILAMSRVWIAGPTRHDEFDHSPDDGNWFDATSTGMGDLSIMAGIGGAGAGVICKSRETYAIHGTSPDDFDLTKISSDGALGCNAITTWKNNVIWLGQDGIWIYDGVNAPVNLVGDSMGPEWSRRLKGFQADSTQKDAGNYPLNKAYCFVYRNHLFVNITNTASTHTVYTDGVARTSNTMQLMIYLPNQALSFLTNFNFVGYLQGFQPNQQEGYALVLQDGSTTHYLQPMSDFFTQGAATTDAILTQGSYNSGLLSTSVGPWYHLESRKFDAGDGLWRKNWKQLAVESNLTNTKRMYLETVAGLNTAGVRAALPFAGIGSFVASRVKFRTRNQYMSFRLYEDIVNRPATLILGAWQWGYKFARRGAM